MYYDILNPLGRLGGGVHRRHEQTLFVTLKPPQWTKFPYHFQVKTSPLFSFCQCSNDSF